MKALYISPRDHGAHLRLGRRPVKEIMSKPVIVVSATAMLNDALMLMIKTGVRHLAVLDDAGRCVGVLSDRTIAATWAADYAALTKRTVSASLDSAPATVSENAAVVDAARLMRACGVDAVAVVDSDDRPIGIVTSSDFISLLAR